MKFPKIHVGLMPEPCVIGAWPDPSSTEGIREVRNVSRLASGNKRAPNTLRSKNKLETLPSMDLGLNSGSATS